MVYFISLAASIGVSYQFFKTFKDYSNMGLYEYLKNKELEKLYVKYNFNKAGYDKLQDTVDKLQGKLKSNLLINL